MSGQREATCTDADDLQLEVMKKEDHSWHPCQVSLSLTGAGLVVHYGKKDKDILVSEKEALMRLRGRSLPLHDDDCTHIKQGEHVLVSRNSQSESSCFDAEVVKVIRVRHSKRTLCRCTFQIKWLHQDLNEGSFVVPSGSLLRLANKSIKTHPTISAFLEAVQMSNASFSSMTSLPNVADDNDDLHELLEKQIEGIRNSVGSSKKKTRDEILSEGGEDKNSSVSNARKQDSQISPSTRHLRRSSRKTPQTPEAKDQASPVIPTPPIHEEISENRSHLSPLAARAALASLMSKLPQSLEMSFVDEEGEGFTDPPGVIAHKQQTVESLNTTEYCSAVINNICTANKLSSKTEAAIKPDRIVKSLFSTSSQSDTSEVMVSPTVLVNQSKKVHTKAGGPDFSRSTTEFREENKISPKIRTRLSRSAVEKGRDIPVDTVEGSTCVDENTLSSTTNRRFTRSALRKEGESQATETIDGVERNASARYEELSTSDNKVRAEGRCTSKDEKVLATTSLPATEINSLPAAGRKSIVKTIKEGKIENDIKGKICTVDTDNSRSMRRITRSSAKEIEILDIEAVQESGPDEFPGNGAPELSGGMVSTLDITVLQKPNTISLPFHADTNLAPAEGEKKIKVSGAVKITQEDNISTNVNIDLPPTKQRNMKRKTSGVAITTQDTEGNVTSDGGRSHGVKRKSANLVKHELRFSPRLRFLPKTRSQNKA